MACEETLLEGVIRFISISSFLVVFFFYYGGGQLLEVGNDGIEQFTEIGAPLVAFYWVSISVCWDFVLC